MKVVGLISGGKDSVFNLIQYNYAIKYFLNKKPIKIVFYEG